MPSYPVSPAQTNSVPGSEERFSDAASQSLVNKRRWLWWARRFFVSVLALLVVVVVVTLLLGTKAKADLIAQYPPTGQMVDVGDYRLHLDCRGNGSPTVVMEAGLTDASLTWSLVQPQVAALTRVCVYDRGGLGWSDASPRPRTAEVMVDELHTLLQNAHIEAPYIMVGHSTGGMLVRLYAHLYSAEVVGMVLVDAQHEGQFSRLPAVEQAMQQVFARDVETLPLYRALATTGIGALVPAIAAMADNPALPSPAREAYSALLLSDSKFVEARAAETTAIFDSLAQVRAAHITNVGNIPLIVLYHGVTDAPWPGMTLEEYTQWWQTLQAELAALSPQGELVVAEQSGHYIQLDQPDLVIDAIERVLTATQS